MEHKPCPTCANHQSEEACQQTDDCTACACYNCTRNEGNDHCYPRYPDNYRRKEE